MWALFLTTAHNHYLSHLLCYLNFLSFTWHLSMKTKSFRSLLLLESRPQPSFIQFWHFLSIFPLLSEVICFLWDIAKFMQVFLLTLFLIQRVAISCFILAVLRPCLMKFLRYPSLFPCLSYQHLYDCFLLTLMTMCHLFLLFQASPQPFTKIYQALAAAFPCGLAYF